MIHRPERHHIVEDQQRHCSTKGMGILNVAKHRNGSTGRVYYSYNPSMTRITTFSEQPFSDDELRTHGTQAEVAQRNSRSGYARSADRQQPNVPWWVYKKKTKPQQPDTPQPQVPTEKSLFDDPR